MLRGSTVSMHYKESSRRTKHSQSRHISVHQKRRGSKEAAHPLNLGRVPARFATRWLSGFMLVMCIYSTFSFGKQDGVRYA